MVKRIILLIVANIIFLACVVAIYAIGYEYDRAHKLYPESIRLSYDVSMGGVYGQRWERTAKFSLIVGGLANVVILLSWYRKRQRKGDTALDLTQIYDSRQ
jgi:hypothetical protein